MTSSWCEKEEPLFAKTLRIQTHKSPVPEKFVLVTKDDSAGTTPKLKVAKSRFLLLEALSTNSQTFHINWEDAIPNEDDVLFYSSLNAQISMPLRDSLDRARSSR
jgi:hypothetical protein